MSQWQPRQEQVEGGESNRSSHDVNSTHLRQQQQQQQHIPSSNTQSLFPMSNEIRELTWQNGQLAMHGLGPTKPTWGRSNDTLESIVHQATFHNQGHHHPLHLLQHPKLTSMVASSARNCSESSSGQVPVIPGLPVKRTGTDSDQCGAVLQEDQRADTSGCASASATFCRDTDHTTMMTWASYESPTSLKAKTLDDDSACHDGLENQDHEDPETKADETDRSHLHSSRRSRAAAIHNQSERRRRNRINQKMKALQKLVPNASKTDKASMLDEVINYLKQLQAQVNMFSRVSSNMHHHHHPQMMMPLGMQQQHLQMSLLARMGMGYGLGMLDINTPTSRGITPLNLIHPSLPTFVPSPFLMPSMIAPNCPPPQPHPSRDSADSNPSVPMPDPYFAFLAQSMNMAALYRQQVNQTTQATSSPSHSNHVQSD